MIAIKIILLIMSVFLVVAVLLQEGKSEGLSALGGGSDSYLGKGKGKGKKKSEILPTVTTVVAIVFVVVVILLGTFEQRNSSWYPEMNPNGTIQDPSYVSTTVPAGTTSAPATSVATSAATPAETPAVTTAPATVVE